MNSLLSAGGQDGKIQPVHETNQLTGFFLSCPLARPKKMYFIFPAQFACIKNKIVPLSAFPAKPLRFVSTPSRLRKSMYSRVLPLRTMSYLHHNLQSKGTVNGSWIH